MAFSSVTIWVNVPVASLFLMAYSSFRRKFG